MIDNPVSRRAAWVAVALLWVAALFNYLDRNVIATLHGPMLADVPMTEARFGMLTSILLWVYGLASPWCGFLADRFSRRKVIYLSLLVWSIVTWLTGRMHSFAGLFWMRAIMGVSEACFLPAALALVCDYHRGPTRSRATALLNSGTYTGGAIAGLGGYLAAVGGWRFGYAVLGAAGAGYALFLILFLGDAPAVTRAGMAAEGGEGISLVAGLRELFRRPAFWVLELLNTFTSVANWVIYSWLPIFLQERFHLAIGPAGISATGFLQAASFLFILIGGVWADRWSRRNLRGRMYVPAIGFCVAGPGLWAIGAGSSLWVVLLGVVGYGVGRGCYDANTMPMLRQLVDERYSATGYGFLNCVASLAGGVMTYVSGMLRDAQIGLEIVFKVCAVCILAASVLLFFLRPRPASIAVGAPVAV
jgi:MFS family permease